MIDVYVYLCFTIKKSRDQSIFKNQIKFFTVNNQTVSNHIESNQTKQNQTKNQLNKTVMSSQVTKKTEQNK